MTIAFNWQNSTYDAAAATSVAVPKGANTIAAGDFLLVAMATKGATDPGAISPPAGWTLAQPNGIAGTSFNVGSAIRWGLFYRIADGTEGSSFTFSWATSTTSSFALLDYTGVNASPFDGGAETDYVNSTYTTSFVAPAITTATANDFEICCWTVYDGGAVTPPGGMTSRVNLGNGSGNGPGLYLSDLSIPTAGSQSAQTLTAGSNNSYNAVSFAIKPASGGGGATDDRAFQNGAMQAITLMRERASGLLEPVRELWRPKRPKLIVPGFAF